MSNLGLEQFLSAQGLQLHRTQVGDRYILEKMRGGQWNLGGEPSGHVIMSDYSTTGDALIAALQVLALLVEEGRPLSEVGRAFAPVPQVLRNMRYGETDPLEAPDVQAAIEAGRVKLGAAGRVLIRKSGTEPVIRVMVEGADQAQITEVCEQICTAIEQVQSPKAKAG
jgi:Phosphomannomutase